MEKKNHFPFHMQPRNKLDSCRIKHGCFFCCSAGSELRKASITSKMECLSQRPLCPLFLWDAIFKSNNVEEWCFMHLLRESNVTTHTPFLGKPQWLWQKSVPTVAWSCTVHWPHVAAQAQILVSTNEHTANAQRVSIRSRIPRADMPPGAVAEHTWQVQYCECLLGSSVLMWIWKKIIC